MALKAVSFAISELYMNSQINKKRKTMLKNKEKEFNEKHMDKGYYLAVNEYVILLFKIKDEYKIFEKSYNDLNGKCKKLLDCYFDKIQYLF